MGSLCGGSPTTSTQTQNQNVQFAPYGLQHFVDVYNRANTVASQPYQPYTGELVAPMNGYQFAGVNQIMDYGQAAQPWINQAGNQVNNAYNVAAGGLPWIGQGAGNVNTGAGMIAGANPTIQSGIGNIQAGAGQIGGAQGYMPTAAGLTLGGAQGVGNIGANDISQYMNPFQSQVINATLANMAENNAIQQQQVMGNAAMRGALGGSRLGVAQAELARQQGLANNATLAGLNAQNYNQAVQTALTQQQNAQANQARMLAAGNQFGGLGATSAGIGSQLAGTGNALVGAAGQQAGIGNLYAGTGMQLGSLAGQQGSLAGGLGSLGSIYGNLGLQGQNAALTGGQALLGAGTVSQQTQQALDTANYQQYLQQLAFPYQQAQFLAGIGLPAAGAMGGFQTQIGSAGQTITPPGISWPQALVGGGAFLGGMFSNRGGRVDGYDSGGGVDLSDEYKTAMEAWSKPIVPQGQSISIPQHQFRSDGMAPLISAPQTSGLSSIANMAGLASAGKGLASGASTLGGWLGLGGGAGAALSGAELAGIGAGIDASLGTIGSIGAGMAGAEAAGAGLTGLEFLPLLFIKEGGRVNSYAPGGGVYPTPGGGQSIIDVQGYIPRMSALQSPKVYHGDFMRMTPLLNISKAASAAPGLGADQMTKLGNIASRLVSVQGEEEEGSARGGRMGYAVGGGLDRDAPDLLSTTTGIPRPRIVEPLPTGATTAIPSMSAPERIASPLSGYDQSNRFPYAPPIPQSFPRPPIVEPLPSDANIDSQTIIGRTPATQTVIPPARSPAQVAQPTDAAAYYIPPPMSVADHIAQHTAAGTLGQNPYQQAQIANEPNLLAEIAQFGRVYNRGGAARKLATGGIHGGLDPTNRFPYPPPIPQVFPVLDLPVEEPLATPTRPATPQEIAAAVETLISSDPAIGGGGGTGAGQDGSATSSPGSGGLMGLLQGAFPGGVQIGVPQSMPGTPLSPSQPGLKDVDSPPAPPPTNPLTNPPLHPDVPESPPPSVPVPAARPAEAPMPTFSVPTTTIKADPPDTPTPAPPAPPDESAPSSKSSPSAGLITATTTADPAALGFGLTGNPGGMFSGLNAGNLGDPASDAFAAGMMGLNAGAPGFTGVGPVSGPGFGSQAPGGGTFGTGLNGPGITSGFNVDGPSAAMGILGPGFSTSPGAPVSPGPPATPEATPDPATPAPPDHNAVNAIFSDFEGGPFGSNMAGFNQGSLAAPQGIFEGAAVTSPGALTGISNTGFNSPGLGALAAAAMGYGFGGLNNSGFNADPASAQAMGSVMSGYGLNAPASPAPSAPSQSSQNEAAANAIGLMMGDNASTNNPAAAPAAQPGALETGFNAIANTVANTVADMVAPAPMSPDAIADHNASQATQAAAVVAAMNAQTAQAEQAAQAQQAAQAEQAAQSAFTSPGLPAGFFTSENAPAGMPGMALGSIVAPSGFIADPDANSGMLDTGFGNAPSANPANFGFTTAMTDMVGNPASLAALSNMEMSAQPDFGFLADPSDMTPSFSITDALSQQNDAEAGINDPGGQAIAADITGALADMSAAVNDAVSGFTGDGVGISGDGAGISGDGAGVSGDGGSSGGVSGGGDGGGTGGMRRGGYISTGGAVYPQHFLQGYQEGGDTEENPLAAAKQQIADQLIAQRPAVDTFKSRFEAVEPTNSFTERFVGDRPQWAGETVMPEPRPPMANLPRDTELSAAPQPPMQVNPYAAAAAKAGPSVDPSTASWADIMNPQHQMYANAAPPRKSFTEIMRDPRDRSRALMEFGARVLSADPGRGWGAAIGTGALGTMQTFDTHHDKDLTARQKAQTLATNIRKYVQSFGEQQRHHKVSEDQAQQRIDQSRLVPLGMTDQGKAMLYDTKTGKTMVVDPPEGSKLMGLGRYGGAGTGAMGATQRARYELAQIAYPNDPKKAAEVALGIKPVTDHQLDSYLVKNFPQLIGKSPEEIAAYREQYKVRTGINTVPAAAMPGTSAATAMPDPGAGKRVSGMWYINPTTGKPDQWK